MPCTNIPGPTRRNLCTYKPTQENYVQQLLVFGIAAMSQVYITHILTNYCGEHPTIFVPAFHILPSEHTASQNMGELFSSGKS